MFLLSLTLSSKQHIREVFTDLPQDRCLVLKYLDDEGDAISVSGEHDLREAYFFYALSSITTLRFELHPLDRKLPSPATEEKASEEAKEVVICDAPASKTKEEWIARMHNIRGKFRGFVEVFQKIGSLIQKKLEVQ